MKTKTEVILETFVAGVVYGNLREKHYKLLKDGTKLSLVKEPDNKVDEDAILVMLGKIKLGYIPTVETSTIHTAGVPLRCTLVNFAKTNPTHRQVLIKVEKQTSAKPDKKNTFPSF